MSQICPKIRLECCADLGHADPIQTLREHGAAARFRSMRCNTLRMAVLDRSTSRRNEADRFDTPLYTVAEAARYLDVPPSTLATWAHGYVRRPPGRAEVHGPPTRSRQR